MAISPTKSIAILAARLIVAGDVQAARAWLQCKRTPGFAPCEARAIAGACEYARKHYGAPAELTLRSFY